MNHFKIVIISYWLQEEWRSRWFYNCIIDDRRNKNHIIKPWSCARLIIIFVPTDKFFGAGVCADRMSAAGKNKKKKPAGRAKRQRGRRRRRRQRLRLHPYYAYTWRRAAPPQPPARLLRSRPRKRYMWRFQSILQKSASFQWMFEREADICIQCSKFFKARSKCVYYISN